MASTQTVSPARAPVTITEVVGSYPLRGDAETHARSLRREVARPGTVLVAARGLHAVEADELVPPVSVTVALGAASSAIAAAVVVGLFGALDPTISLFGVFALAFYALIFGAVGGALMGGLFYGLRTRHASLLPPHETFEAERFDVLIEHLPDRL